MGSLNNNPKKLTQKEENITIFFAEIFSYKWRESEWKSKTNF